MYIIVQLNQLQPRIPMAVMDATLRQKRQSLHEVGVFVVFSMEQSMDFAANHYRKINC